MKALVHIGLPKTGTTSLQSFLRRNEVELLQRGFVYDSTLNSVDRNSQMELGFYALAEKDKLLPTAIARANKDIHELETQRAVAKQFDERLRSIAKRSDVSTALLSSEHVSAWLTHRNEIEALDAWLSSIFDRVEYVMYIRNQCDWIASNYSQGQNAALTQTLAEFVTRNPVRNYSAKVNGWADVVGRERFHLRLLEQDFLYDGDVVSDFAHVAGFDMVGLQPVARANESFSAAAIYLLNALNKMSLPTAADGKTRNPLIVSMSSLIARLGAGQTKLGLSDELIETIENANEMHNEMLRDEYFPDRPRLFAKVKPKGSMGTTPPAEEIVELAARLILALRTNEVPQLTDRQIAIVKSASSDASGSGNARSGIHEKP